MNHKRLSVSTICCILTHSSFTPNIFHIDRFHDAPSDTIVSTLSPDCSVRIIHSIIILCKIDALVLPTPKKQAKH